MDINNKARIHWACRRGMRELDISIMPFFEHEYDSLSDDEKRIFIRRQKKYFSNRGKKGRR